MLCIGYYVFYIFSIIVFKHSQSDVEVNKAQNPKTKKKQM